MFLLRLGQEFKKIAVACAIGFSIMGFIGHGLGSARRKSASLWHIRMTRCSLCRVLFVFPLCLQAWLPSESRETCREGRTDAPREARRNVTHNDVYRDRRHFALSVLPLTVLCCCCQLYDVAATATAGFLASMSRVVLLGLCVFRLAVCCFDPGFVASLLAACLSSTGCMASRILYV